MRHIERNSLLLFMVPIDSPDIIGDYNVLLNELGKYSPELLTKDKILAITKCDMADEELLKMVEKDLKKGLKKEGPINTFFISAVTGFGIDKLKNGIMKMLDTANPPKPIVKDIEPDIEPDYE